MNRLAGIIFMTVVVFGLAYLFVEAAIGECVGASYCEKVNAK